MNQKCKELGHDYVCIETTWPVMDLAKWIKDNYPKKYDSDKQYESIA